MILRSPVAKAISLLTSALVVGGGAWLAKPDLVIEMDGAGEVVEARMGTAFEDMVQGTLEAKTTTDVTPQKTPPDQAEQAADAEPTPPTDPVEVARADRAETAPTPGIQAAPTTAPAEPTPPQQTAARAQQVTPETGESSPPQAALTPPTGGTPVLSATPQDITDAVVAPPLLAPTPQAALVPTAPLQPLRPVAAAPSDAAPQTPPVETLAAQTPDSTAPPNSIRPRRKDPDLAAKIAAARPQPKVAKAQPKAKPQVTRGNAQRNNTQGTDSGNAKSEAKTEGTTQRASAQTGNVAAFNYPGKVMRRISRVPKPRVNSRGTTVVSFSISAGGGLARVSVARSSGSTALDQAAVRVIRKAAPFPKPPHGAQRQFSIKIKGQ